MIKSISPPSLSISSVGGSSYLYVKDRDALAAAERILRELPDTVKQYVRVVSKKQIEKIGGNPEVALALSGLNGAAFGNAVSGEAVRPGHGGQHLSSKKWIKEIRRPLSPGYWDWIFLPWMGRRRGGYFRDNRLFSPAFFSDIDRSRRGG
jgi:hypothetical protein